MLAVAGWCLGPQLKDLSELSLLPARVCISRELESGRSQSSALNQLLKHGIQTSQPATLSLSWAPLPPHPLLSLFFFLIGEEREIEDKKGVDARMLSNELSSGPTHPTCSGIWLPGCVWLSLLTECFVCTWKTASGLRGGYCQLGEHDPEWVCMSTRMGVCYVSICAFGASGSSYLSSCGEDRKIELPGMSQQASRRSG